MIRAVPILRQLEWAAFGAGLIVALGLVALHPGATATLVTIALTIGALVAWITWQDLAVLTISNAAVLAIAAVAIAARCATAHLASEPASHALLTAAIDAALPGALLLAFREIYYRRAGHDGLGLGDVKLAAAGGILVGTVGFSWALFVASAAALAFVGFRRIAARPLASSDKLAFGAVLAPALWVVWIAEQTPFLTGS